MKTFHMYISASRHPVETIATTDFTALLQEKTFLLCLFQVLSKAKAVTTYLHISILLFSPCTPSAHLKNVAGLAYLCLHQRGQEVQDPLLYLLTIQTLFKSYFHILLMYIFHSVIMHSVKVTAQNNTNVLMMRWWDKGSCFSQRKQTTNQKPRA